MNDLRNIEDSRRVKEIFAQAIEAPVASRGALVVDLCAGDKALIEEVHSWLASYDESENFLEESTFSKENLFETSSAAGRIFGPYTIDREIGHGGMGAVYLAHRTDGEFEQQVALKIVRQSIAEEHVIERFRSERQILASLSHSYIAKLLDGGVSETGEPFIAMEYIEGETITDFVRRTKPSLNDMLQLFIKVCSAVAYAHRNLVVHRDIKPGNILVTADGEPKLLDFGLAKLVDESLSADGNQTQTAFRALTPAYASPEQLKGRPLTTASDIYSLGVVFYELLAGHRPFVFDGKSLDEIIKTVTGSAPPVPSFDPKSKIRNPKLRGDLDNIALMALRNEADRRYSTVDVFADDIERYIKGLPVSARPNTYKYRASKYFKRHRVGVAAAMLVFASLIGGVAVSLWQTRQARLERDKAEAVGTFMEMMLGASSPDSNLQTIDHELTVKEVLDAASKRLATQDLSDQPEVKAELQRIIGASYYTLGQYDLAEHNLNTALDAQTRIYGPDHLETLETMVVLGSLWVTRGDNAKAESFYRRSVPSLRVALKNGNIKADYLLLSLGNFALLRRAAGDSKEAETLLREGLALAPQLSDDSKSNLSIQEAVFALTLADQGNFAEAEQIIQAKVESIRQQEDLPASALGVNLTGLGSFQMEQGKLSEAKQSLRDGEAIYRKLFDKDNLQLGDNLRLQAQTLFLENKYAEAERKIDETLRIYRSGTNTKYINYATALTIQGLIYSRTNRSEEAEKLLREAVALRVENLPEIHFLRATADGELGEFLTAQGRFAEAEPLLLKSYESLVASQVPGSPRLAAARVRLSSLYSAWKKPDIAKKYSG